MNSFMFWQASCFDIVIMFVRDHAGCVFPQVCMMCIRCKSCGVTPGKSWDTEWNHDKGFCPDCTRLYDQGGSTKHVAVVLSMSKSVLCFLFFFIKKQFLKNCWENI